MPFLVDTHCHIHFPAFDEDREAVLLRMREKRIWGITIGTALNTSESAIRFAESHEDIWATVGLHPSHTTHDHFDANEGEAERIMTKEDLVRLAKSSKKVVAIGETGLDSYRFDQVEDADQAQRTQEESFRMHLEAAHELDAPVVIHCRDALGRLAEMIQEERNAGRNPKGVVHSFTGTWAEAKPLLDLGLHIAVNGIAMFPLKKSQDPETAIDRTIERIPMERLLLETDAPYLAPPPHRGKRNEPAFVEHVAEHVASVRGVSLEEIARHTTANARELFRT